MKISLPRFNKAHVLVVGDLMLDRYWQGQSARISPEAPVPVIDVASTEERPGGAANVALNVAALGASCTLIGAVGKDEEGHTLRRKLEAAGVECHFVEQDNWRTPLKLRVVSQHQQLLRMDFEDRLPQECCAVIESLVAEHVAGHDCVILQDYDKGVIGNPGNLIQAAVARSTPVVVDPKHKALSAYAGATLIKPNMSEFEAQAGILPDYKTLQQAADRLVKDCGLLALLITRGAEGMLLVEADGKHANVPSRAVDVHDVTGAGDTVAAVMGTMIALGEGFEASAMVANVAASIVVSKLGTASATAAEIQRELTSGLHADRGVLGLDALKEQVDGARALGEKIVFTNGCFDILHAGHISYLEEARAMGDRLIVGINSDASVRELKGPDRPVNNLEARMHVLSGLSAVDWVVAFSESTPENLLRDLQPDLLVKGGDYGISGVVGADIVQAYGGEVRVLGLVEGVSTSRIIRASRKKAKR